MKIGEPFFYYLYIFILVTYLFIFTNKNLFLNGK